MQRIAGAVPAPFAVVHDGLAHPLVAGQVVVQQHARPMRMLVVEGVPGTLAVETRGSGAPDLARSERVRGVVEVVRVQDRLVGLPRHAEPRLLEQPG